MLKLSRNWMKNAMKGKYERPEDAAPAVKQTDEKVGDISVLIKCDDINIDFALNDAPKHVLNSIKATLSSIIADFYSVFR